MRNLESGIIIRKNNRIFMAKQNFQAEITPLLDLMVNSLYSNKEIFLRELVSNASDALDKLNHLILTDERYKELDFKPRIDVSFDDKKNTLTIEDNGIGMDEDELVTNLGTIAKSGTKSFIEQLSGDKRKDSALIGQFGVGFYSSFMVADRVVVTTRKPLLDQALCWVSDGKSGYEISQCVKDSFGTSITLYLKKEDTEFATKYRLQAIIKKYSSHIQFPIFLHFLESSAKDEGKDDKESKDEQKIEQINSAQAIWRRPKSELKREDYSEFYKSLSFDKEDPIAYVHTQAEGSLEYQSLFYIPKKAPFDLYRVDYQSGVKLYVRRVFITDDDKELLPQYLRFIRGVIDTQDLPLNVSREILQQNKILSNIKSQSTKKILNEIAQLSKDESVYKDFYKEYGKVLKEGLNDFENKDKILELLRFNTTTHSFSTLKDYAERMSSDQKSIYYVLGDKEDALRSLGVLERYKTLGFEVLLLGDEVDAFVIPQIYEYKKSDGSTIALKDATSPDSLSELKDEAISDEVQKDFSPLIDKFKEVLGERVSEVRLSGTIESPLVLVLESENKMLQNIFAQMGQEAPKSKASLELNVKHPLILALKGNVDNSAPTIETLYSISQILNGKIPEDTNSLGESIWSLMQSDLLRH